MREILFRGKRVDNGEWMQGDLLQNVDCLKIREKEKDIKHIARSFVVFPETVGQYTGLTDTNGTKIFEGDIVLFPWGEKREVFSVEFVEGEFEAIPKRKSVDIWCIRIGSYAPEFEVIGNIHDTPELLEGGAE